MWISNTIIGLILLALAIAGAWRWYEAQSKNQMMERQRHTPGTAELVVEQHSGERDRARQ